MRDKSMILLLFLLAGLGAGLEAGLAPSPEQDQAVASGRAKYTELSAAGAMPR